MHATIACTCARSSSQPCKDCPFPAAVGAEAVGGLDGSGDVSVDAIGGGEGFGVGSGDAISSTVAPCSGVCGALSLKAGIFGRLSMSVTGGPWWVLPRRLLSELSHYIHISFKLKWQRYK